MPNVVILLALRNGLVKSKRLVIRHFRYYILLTLMSDSILASDNAVNDESALIVNT